jgi:hypothetical protein
VRVDAGQHAVEGKPSASEITGKFNEWRFWANEWAPPRLSIEPRLVEDAERQLAIDLHLDEVAMVVEGIVGQVRR